MHHRISPRLPNCFLMHLCVLRFFMHVNNIVFIVVYDQPAGYHRALLLSLPRIRPTHRLGRLGLAGLLRDMAKLEAELKAALLAVGNAVPLVKVGGCSKRHAPVPKGVLKRVGGHTGV